MLTFRVKGLLFLFLVLCAGLLGAQENPAQAPGIAPTNPLQIPGLPQNPPSPADFFVKAYADIGFTAVLSHTYRSGDEASGNTMFDYVTQGGQDNLYLHTRFSVDAVIVQQHVVSFLFQPLTLKTQTVSNRNGTGVPTISGVTFPSGTPMDLVYGFDFFRLSYLYDFLPQPESELGLGLSFQLRNANISFSSTDGSLRTVQDNVGLVPIIKLKESHWFTDSFGLEFEGDGFYASSAIFNGSGKPFEGWIWDAALRVKTRFLPGTVVWLSIRSIGGGASGNNAYDNLYATSGVAGESTWNALATLIPSIGISLQ